MATAIKPEKNKVKNKEENKEKFNEKSKCTPYIMFDLDGTLSHWDEKEWEERGFEYIGKPISSMISLVKAYLAEGFNVKIFTARAENPESIPFIRAWLKENELPEDLDITYVKDYQCEIFYDDRAVGIVQNMGVTDSQQMIMFLVEPIKNCVTKYLNSRVNKLSKLSTEDRAIAEVVKRLRMVAEEIL